MVSKAERLQKQLEVSTERAKAAKAALTELRLVQNHKAQKDARKKRNHELFEAAGLMILADLVDTKTGIPTVDRGALLGGLLAVAKTLGSGPEATNVQKWKNTGDARLAEQETARKPHTTTSPNQEHREETISEALTNILSDNALRD